MYTFVSNKFYVFKRSYVRIFPLKYTFYNFTKESLTQKTRKKGKQIRRSFCLTFILEIFFESIDNNYFGFYQNFSLLLLLLSRCRSRLHTVRIIIHVILNEKSVCV